MEITRCILMAIFCLIQVAAFSQTSFEKHTISAIPTPMDVYVCDMDLDGHLDILTGARGDGGQVCWWRNDGTLNFTRFLVKGNFASPRSVRGGDIDGDGDMDVIAAGWEANRISWWENDGFMGFTEHIIESQMTGPHTVELSDLDLDGDMDVICSQFDNSAASSSVAWWENDGSQNWTRHIVTSRFQQSPFAFGADMDADGDIDIVSCGELNGEVLWYENNGTMVFSEHMIDPAFAMAHTILPRDLDKDGDLDILAHACMSSKQAWYENKGSGNFDKHEMENLGGAIWLDMADFDLDGDEDMVATGMSATSLVCYVNNGRQNFTRQDITGPLASGFALNVADMDKDGDPDVVAIGYSSNTLAWWENKLDRTTLLDQPSWLIPSGTEGSFLVANQGKGNVVLCDGVDPVAGLAAPGYCQGMVVVNGKLWMASGTSLNRYDPVAGICFESIRTTTQYIEDMAGLPDGTICFSAPWDGSLYRFETISGQIELISDGFGYPRALYYDDYTDQLMLLDGEEEVTIKWLNPSDGQVLRSIQTFIQAGGDVTGDQSGNYYISAPGGNAIYLLKSGSEQQPQLYLDGLPGPWGMIFLPESNEILVAMSSAGILQKIPAYSTSSDDHQKQAAGQIQIYPNPFQNQINIVIPPDDQAGLVSVRVIDPTGRPVAFSDLQADSGQLLVLQMDNRSGNTGVLAAGLYLVMIRRENRIYTKTILKNH